MMFSLEILFFLHQFLFSCRHDRFHTALVSPSLLCARLSMPCRWVGAAILVMESVLIVEPYGADNCSSQNAQQLARIQKIVCLRR
jgi:hypothetical protein